MSERQRLLALLKVYDEAIQELYLLGGREHIDLILRLERRLQDTQKRLDKLSAVARPLTAST